MPEQEYMRIHGHGEVEIEAVITYLQDLRDAYNSLILFETILDRVDRIARESPYGYGIGLPIDWPMLRRRGGRQLRDWPPRPDEVARFVPASEQLVISAVKISSPGFWEVVGSLNPLEVLRKAINDRHERRKDRDFREAAERRRLDLENQMRETEVFAKRIALMREYGITEREFASLFNELVFRPIAQLDRSQDQGVITYAERVSKPDGPKEHI